ncbi:MAG: T9SS type A sorting domain-containing protein [Bacteroidales bacterium]|nr:T9SS type A sorting domain-containing protein [Bacteroidales bacterium]MBN2819959.1 T9SS type A sorting domain-containing protein [Bacteroidales bacterium]
MRVVFTIIFLVISSLAGLIAQNTIISGEYWFNSGFNERTSILLTGSENIQYIDNIDVSSLNVGLNSVQLRFKDSDNVWSSVISSFFVIRKQGEINIAKTIDSYEYWIDNDFNGRLVKPVSSLSNFNLIESIDVSGLIDGLHSIQYRFKDSEGAWSSVFSKFFLKKTDNTFGANQIVSLEYWFDSGFNDREIITLESAKDLAFIDNIDVSSLNKGLHSLHFRFKDIQGFYSSVVSGFVILQNDLPEAEDNKITGYRYWLDSNSVKNIEFTSPQANISLQDSISLYELRKGEYLFTIQYKDSRGYWSSPVTDTILKHSFPIAGFNTSSNVVCDTGTVAFEGSAFDADSIIWSIDGNPVGTDSSFNWHFTKTGNYLVQLTAMDTVLNTDSVYSTTIIVDSIVTNVIQTTNTETCEGDSVLLEAVSGYNYSWNTSETSASVYASNEQWYIVEISTVNNCRQKDSAYVLVHETPVVDLGSDRTTCGVDTLKLSQSYAQQYWNDIAGNSTYLVTSTGKYVVDVYNEGNCHASDSINITILEAPDVNLGGDRSNCGPDTLRLPKNYVSQLWNGVPGDSILPVSTSGKYVVKATNAYNCTASDSVTITINESPVIELGENRVACGSDTIKPGNEFSYYYYNGLAGGSEYLVTNSGKYIVKVVDVNNCDATDSIQLTILAVPNIELGENREVCGVDTLRLNQSYTSHYWNGVSGDSMLVIMSDGMYTIVVTNEYNCSATDSIEVVVHAVPDLELGNDRTACGTDTLKLDQQYQQQVWNGISGTGELVVTETGLYKVEVIDDNNCSANDSVNVTIYSLPEVYLGEDRVSCGPDTIRLDKSYPTHTWNGLNGDSAFVVASSKQVVLVVTDENNCSNSDTVQVSVNDIPVIDLGPDVNISDDESVQLDAGAGYSEYSWFDSDNSQTRTILGSDLQLGENLVHVNVIDNNNCVGSDTVKIYVTHVSGINTEYAAEPIKLYPNPVQDEFKLEVPQNFTDIEIRIFNSLGAEIYRQEIIQNISSIDMSDFDNGTYFIYINSREYSGRMQFVLYK